MRKTLGSFGVVCVVSLTIASQAWCGPAIPYGSATVDGDLSDWATASWNAFDTVYDSAPVDITGGQWAARWTPTGVYMAVKVQDTAHVFTDTYTDWAARDSVEMYIHTTGAGGDYSGFQEPAQEWAVGMKTAANGSVWTGCGYAPVYGDYTATPSQFVAAGAIDGDWLYYEARMTPFEYFGGRRSTLAAPVADIVSPLSPGMIIGVDCTAVSNDGVSQNSGIPGYAGMKCSALGQTSHYWWSSDYSRISQSALLPSLAGDVDSNGTVNVADLTALLNNYNKSPKGWTDGDFTGDSLVNVSDLTALLNNYNKSVGGIGGLNAATNQVPEPTSVAMLASLLALLAVWAGRGSSLTQNNAPK